ncbi:MAG: helix-turn-helix domain-containing protein [Methylomarinum sp.]|nr:helix-turn-helix domain-containing protein [Methylomarinum sp.]
MQKQTITTITEIQQPNERELLTSVEAARILAMSPKTLARWRCQNNTLLPSLKIGGLVRYMRKDVNDFIDSCK